MSATELLLIDLSSIAYPIYEMSGREPDPDHVATQIVVKVRQLASQHPHAAVCLDSGKSFRHDLAPDYKANRDTTNRAVLKVQIDNACATLRGDGFPVWASAGYEADDVIATAVREALAMDPDVTVLIASADKDLAQLVSDRVRIKNTHPKSDGQLRGPAEVLEKWKVRPDQMLDYLCLVGDSGDNVKGADGIGPVKAAGLLNALGTLDAVYAAMAQGVVPGVTPAMRTSLMAFRERLPLVRQLIALKSDAPISFAEIAVEREARPMEMEGFVEEDAPRELPPSDAADTLGAATTKVAERIANGPTPEDVARMRNAPVVPYVEPQLPVLAPRDYSQELEPRSMDEAVKLAQRMFESRLFSAYGTPQAVLSTVLAGRELGIPAMASLRAFHIIEGKPQLSAGAIVSLVLKSGKARYFRCTERTDTRATYCTQRGDDPELCLSYTIEEGKQAWPKDEAAWRKSGWGRNPADMLVARASSKLARLVYPDVVSGLYAPEEMD